MKARLDRSFGFALAVILTCSSGCAGKAFRTEQDSSFNLRDFSTYSWLDTDSAKRLGLETPALEYSTTRVTVKRNPRIEDDIKAEINVDLQSRGYEVAQPTEAPDFYVTYYGQARDDDWISTWDGNPPGFVSVPVVTAPEYDRTTLRNHARGDVAIVFYDSKTGKPVWSGTVPSVIEEANEAPEKLAASLDQLFKKLPKQTG